MKRPSGAESDPRQQVIKAQKVILEFFQTGQRGSESSVKGYRPDGDMRYDDERYAAKDKGAAYTEYMAIFEDIGDHTSLETYLTEKCQAIMVDPEPRWRQIIDFIEKRFEISVQPAEKSTSFYDGCVRGWLEQIHEDNPTVSENEVKAYMPFEEFDTLERAGQIGNAVRKVLQHFKAE